MHGSPPPARPHWGLCADCGGLLPPGANSGYTLGDPLRSGLCRMGERTFCSVLFWRTHVLETSQDRMVSGRVDSTPSPAAPLEGRAPGRTSCPGPGTEPCAVMTVTLDLLLCVTGVWGNAKPLSRFRTFIFPRWCLFQDEHTMS